jgi:hypothetical protein
MPVGSTQRLIEMKTRNLVESEVFWRWCITLRITGFLGFLHRPESGRWTKSRNRAIPSTRNLPVGKRRSERESENFTAILLAHGLQNLWASTTHQYGLPRPSTEIAFFTFRCPLKLLTHIPHIISFIQSLRYVISLGKVPSAIPSFPSLTNTCLSLNLGSLLPVACVRSRWECFPSTQL